LGVWPSICRDKSPSADLHIADDPRADHAQYPASWLAVLKAYKKAIFTAASKASEAAAFRTALQGTSDFVAFWEVAEPFDPLGGFDRNSRVGETEAARKGIGDHASLSHARSTPGAIASIACWSCLRSEPFVYREVSPGVACPVTRSIIESPTPARCIKVVAE